MMLKGYLVELSELKQSAQAEGDRAAFIKAIDVQLRIISRISEMQGVDMPVKIAPTDPTGTMGPLISVILGGEDKSQDSGKVE